jgi:hypothetical protein
MRMLTDKEVCKVAGGKITPVTTQLNGGGNTPRGEANGVPIITTNLNPSGFAPSGHNK